MRPAVEISGGGVILLRIRSGVVGRGEKAYIGIDVEALVIQHSLSEVHHLLENEQVFEVVGNFLSNKLYKIWHELVQAWVTFQASNCSASIIQVVFVE